MVIKKVDHSLSFRIGVFLIIFNIPLGWVIGPLFGTWIGVHTQNAGYGIKVGFFIYILSWIVFGVGIGLAGKHGVDLSRRIRRRIPMLIRLNRWKKIRELRVSFDNINDIIVAQAEDVVEHVKIVNKNVGQIIHYKKQEDKQYPRSTNNSRNILNKFFYSRNNRVMKNSSLKKNLKLDDSINGKKN